MKRLCLLALVCFQPLSAPADVIPFAAVPAAEAVLADYLYQKRPVIVFADSPLDPDFIHQMKLLEQDFSELAERDVVLITDTDPAAETELRRKLHPHGFSLVLMDKDGRPVMRKPLPWDVREITRAIDKFPLRRQEIRDRQDAAGRSGGSGG
jgi:hypothetical protein